MNNPHATKLRYFAGAVLFAFLNNVILIAGDAVGIGYVTLTFVCFFVTGALAYIFHTRFTFRQKLRFGGYVTFLAGQFIGLMLTLLALHVFYRSLALPMWIAAPTVTVLMLVFNYAAAKFAAAERPTR